MPFLWFPKITSYSGPSESILFKNEKNESFSDTICYGPATFSFSYFTCSFKRKFVEFSLALWEILPMRFMK